MPPKRKMKTTVKATKRVKLEGKQELTKSVKKTNTQKGKKPTKKTTVKKKVAVKTGAQIKRDKASKAADEWNNAVKEMRRLISEAEKGNGPSPSSLKVFTIPQLCSFLKINGKSFSNLNKDTYVKIIVDYMKNGVIPKCPNCNIRTLRFSNGKKKFGKRYYWCPGYYENFGYRAGSCSGFKYCGFKADHVDRTQWKVVRSGIWKIHTKSN